MTAEGNVLIGTIRTNGMVSIKALNGTIQNAGPNSGIWCESLYLYAYGMIGTEESPLLIYSNGTYTSNGGGLLRTAFQASVLTGGALMANSVLYGENIRIIRVVNNPYVPDSDVNGGLPTTTVTDITSGIQVTGRIEKDAVLVVSNVSDHVDCHVCNQLMQYHNRGGRIFVNLKLLCKYTGKLLVRIPVTGEWAKYEGREIVILTCRDGMVWAIRATLTDGFITFLTEKLGSFLIFGDPDQLELTDDGKSIILNQEILPFGGWL
jgi:hypothetical protein